MAKDGTARGGRRPNGGRPAKSLKEKLESGNPGGRKLQVIELPTPPTPDVKADISPREYMSDEQNELNSKLYAKQIFEEVTEWLSKTGCAHLIEREIIDLYAMSAARWIQCEQAISQLSLLSAHPTTKMPMATPLASMSNQYSKTMMNCWYSISQIIKENSLTDFKKKTPQESVMDMLLSN